VIDISPRVRRTVTYQSRAANRGGNRYPRLAAKALHCALGTIYYRDKREKRMTATAPVSSSMLPEKARALVAAAT
jgi:hypothetical protein